MKKELKKLESDLARLAKHWEEVVHDHNLLQQKEFLTDVAKDITDIEKDLGGAIHVQPLGEGVELINYLLNTTWGAPFVFNTPLLEAAQSYNPKHFRDSQLRAILSEFVEYHEELDEQLFACLEEVRTQIRKMA